MPSPGAKCYTISMHYYFDVWKKYAVFEGRTARKPFWMFALWNFIVEVVLFIVFAAIMASTKSHAAIVIFWVYGLAVLLPGLGLSVRRLHDTNRTGWWLLIDVVPLVGPIVLLVFFVMDSTPGDNKYGPNPKGVSAPAPAATN